MKSRSDFAGLFASLPGLLRRVQSGLPRLSPLSLAEKCRLAFGGAVLLVLALALTWPYIWMGQLTNKSCLDASRARAEALFNRHFRPRPSGDTALEPLDGGGRAIGAEVPDVLWLRLSVEHAGLAQAAPAKAAEMIESLKERTDVTDEIVMSRDGGLHSLYVRVVRATESCLSCHNPDGSAEAFSPNETVGAVVIRRPAGQIRKTVLMNRMLVVVAGLIGGAGAIVAFYVITQRVILRPIRQLRAIANNVADGNLDIRSAIKTRDEFEKLASAFNHMLDGLQTTQQKLRQANIQLDAKIAELSQRNIDLFKANKLKGEFLANISHEFRTPLNAILGFAEILKDKSDRLTKDKARRYAENIITSGNRLLNMINDLLDLAKTEAGKMELHLERTSVRSICRTAASHFSALTRKKKIKVGLSVEDGIPELVTDAGKLQQILYNFLSNAVEFTPNNGRIEIIASMPSEKTVRIAVSDTGCGIAPSDREKIFEKFQQVDGSITRRSTGSGLGLAISRELAALLAGSVGLESEQGRGSVFWVDIPVVLTEQVSG
jgi:signal transduction histidine kinase